MSHTQTDELNTRAGQGNFEQSDEPKEKKNGIKWKKGRDDQTNRNASWLHKRMKKEGNVQVWVCPMAETVVFMLLEATVHHWITDIKPPILCFNVSYSMFLFLSVFCQCARVRFIHIDFSAFLLFAGIRTHIWNNVHFSFVHFSLHILRLLIYSLWSFVLAGTMQFGNSYSAHILYIERRVVRLAMSAGNPKYKWKSNAFCWLSRTVANHPSCATTRI